MQPSDIFSIDVWNIVPSMLERRGSRKGALYILAGAIAVIAPENKRLVSSGSYRLQIQKPASESDYATGALYLTFAQSEHERVILLAGTPMGFGDYGWRGFCAQTLRPCEILKFDPCSKIFVAHTALGRPAPKDVQRKDDILDLLNQSNRLFHYPSLQCHPQRPAGITEEELKTLVAQRKKLTLQLTASRSGLPILVFRSDGSLDVFATSRNRRGNACIPKDQLNAISAKIGADYNARMDRIGAEVRRASMKALGFPDLRTLNWTPEEHAVWNAFNKARDSQTERKKVESLGQMLIDWQPVLLEASAAVAKSDVEQGVRHRLRLKQPAASE